MTLKCRDKPPGSADRAASGGRSAHGDGAGLDHIGAVCNGECRARILLDEQDAGPLYSNVKMRFQSFFMLITVQPLFFASS
jgi:hypothetical protein